MTRLPVFALALGAILAACGGGGGAPEATPGPSPAPTANAGRAEAMCGALPELLGAVQNTELTEISGIAASRAHPGVLWAHNDSGGSASAYAIGPQGEDLGTYTLAGVDAVDWEDMAIGPGPDGSVDYLYLADFGDNGAERDDISIYRVPEPDIDTLAPAPVDAQITEGIERFVFTYPGDPHDAEALLVDPDTGEMLIITKEIATPESLVFRAPEGAVPGTPAVLEGVAQIDFPALGAGYTPPDGAPALVAGVPHVVTGGDVSPDGGLIAMRTYGLVWIWERAPDSDLADAFATQPCQAPSALEEQGEAIAFDADGRGYTTISEGLNPEINHFETR